MIILGIETSTAVCSVGLASELELIAERSIVESHIHSEKLLTLVREMCEERKITLQQLDGIAISIGPGSFTGLRIGLSTAKGLSYSLGKPLYDVSTFDAISTSVFISHPEFKRNVICIDAKQGEYYIEVNEKSDGASIPILPVHIDDISSVISSIQSDTIIVTDRIDELKKASGIHVQVESVLPYCRGDIIAKKAFEKVKSGDNKISENLEPLYLKNFIVQTKLK
jgi:tRNA threonylcarbamoyladenosine biosynthesis protein TsaB